MDSLVHAAVTFGAQFKLHCTIFKIFNTTGFIRNEIQSGYIFNHIKIESQN